MKIALCFIISYEHILTKEDIWREWIEPNKDIINIYFYYKDYNKITSEWIKEHTIPFEYIKETSYYHVIPAYLSLMKYVMKHDEFNQWFCFLTDSCCPIISPTHFRNLFYENYNKSILNWKRAWWNTQYHKRANLALLKKELHLANDPWFVMKREHILQTLQFIYTRKDLTKTICNGGLANESLFAIILYCYNQLQPTQLIAEITHITDWTRMTSATSPHLFKTGCEKDISFIETQLKTNKHAMFIRKVAPVFPDNILNHYIYNYNYHNEVSKREPIYFTFRRWQKIIQILYLSLNIYLLLYVTKIIYLYYIK
jgi:hypothetical protein